VEERRTCNAEAGVSTTPSGSKNDGPLCAISGRPAAPKFGSLVTTGTCLACNQEIGVQFPGDPPIVAVAYTVKPLAVNQ
jgi:hypothetical protein